MSKRLYVMQFKGHAAPVSGASNVLKASTTAPSCSIATVVGNRWGAGNVQPTCGGRRRSNHRWPSRGKRHSKSRAVSSLGREGIGSIRPRRAGVHWSEC